MAATSKLEALLEAENAIIKTTAGGLEDILAVFMDQAVIDFERRGQFLVPTGPAHASLLDALTAGWRDGAQFGVGQLNTLSQKADGLSTRAVLEYLERYGVDRTRKIAATTARQLTQIVVTGQRNGLSNAQIMKQLLNRIPRLAATRAKIIAETEVHSAAQFGLYNAALRSTKLLQKVWNTVEDDRVRDFRQGAGYSHRMCEGQKKALDIPFQIPHVSGTTEALRFPGDPEGSAGNIINCRCLMTFEEL